MPQGEPWIGVDFDGTLAYYGDLATNGAELGDPIPAMLERVLEWLEEGTEVRIFTARASRLNKYRESDLHKIEQWCEKHIGRKLPITSEKDFHMISLWDDRAVGVAANTGEVGEERLLTALKAVLKTLEKSTSDPEDMAAWAYARSLVYEYDYQ